MKQGNKALLFGGRLVAVGLVLFVLLLVGLRAGAQEPNLPLVKPEAESGLAVFADRCVGCHGPTGEGDGELAVNLAVPPASFVDPDFRRTAVPGTMFSTIFNGNFEAGMPPFGPGTENTNPIDEATIWELIAAVYSLGTPADMLAQGEALYEENCAGCHGDDGAGNGPEAASWESASLDLTDLRYWFNRSNEAVFADVAPASNLAHDYVLDEEELWAVVDYARTFSYGYVNPSAPVAPIESGTIRGHVNNGTTGETISDATVRLRAFTTSFEETLNLTTTVGLDGDYQFDLEAVSPDWVYLASVIYNGLSFSSDAGQLSRVETELALPITVFESTTNPDAVNIDQMHVIIEFFEGGVSVSELYVFSNREAAVFVGETGLVEEGTVRLSVPDAAQDVSFERTMGSFEGTIPAMEIIQTADGWADTLPLRPGAGGSNLIVRYQLPYEDSLTLSHPVPYDASSATVILPDVGVTLEEEDGWAFQGRQQMPGGSSFLTYDQTNLPAGSSLAFALEGEAALTAGANALAPRDQTNELLIGGGVLLIAVAAGFYIVRSWQTPRQETIDVIDDRSDAGGGGDDISSLLQEIADLDDAFEKGEINEDAYHEKRRQLKDQVKALWV